MATESTRGSSAPGSLEAALAHAWAAREFTAADAMAGTGLTRSTTIEALDRLIDLGLLRELPNARAVGDYRKGRPSRRFELRADAAVVVGVDAGRFHLTAVVADLRGAPLGRVATMTDSDRDDPTARRAQIDEVVAEAVAAAGVEREDVLAICVGVPAAVDAAGASPTHRQGFWQQMNPDLVSVLATRVPLVRIENDAALAAVAEGAVGEAAGVRDFVALLAGERFGVGVVHEGRLVRGARGAAGEAHLLRWVAGVESEAGIGAQLATWARAEAEAGVLPEGHALAGVAVEELTAPTVLELAAAGDAWATGLVERAGSVLARVAAVLATMHDPELIVVCGGVADGLGQVVALANDGVATDLFGPAPRIVASSLGADVVVTGAVMGAVQTARDGALALALQRSAAAR